METVELSTLPVQANEWLLDLGCGEGRHSIAANFYFPETLTIGLDLDFSSLKQATDKYHDFSQAPQNTWFVQSSGFRLPFADQSFDYIICSEVLEHIEQHEMFLEEMERVLKPGGGLYLSVPRAWPEKICWWLSSEYHQVEGGHVKIFKRNQLRNELSKLNFNLHRKHWAHALHTPYWWLRCLWWHDGKENCISKLYHKLLVWDLLKRPWLTQRLEKYLNPVLGKSVVYYFRKGI